MRLGRALLRWYRCIRHFFRRYPDRIQSATAIRPTFGSSFIQSWYCQNWDGNRWLQECQMLQKIGIDEIIIQSIADTKSGYAVYPTKMEGYTCNTIDMVGIALEAADIVGMNVRIGLGFNSDWWVKNASDPEWLNYEASVNKEIALEIMSMYGGHRSLAGWYIPYEFHQLTALGEVHQADLNRFLQQIASAIKLNSNKNIMIAPFYNSLQSWQGPSASWSTIIYHILNNTGIDIVALQDSIGVGFNTLDHLDEIYRYTKKAADAAGIILYAVTETFDATLIGTGKKPAPISRINIQLAQEAPYVQRFVAFSIDHYQNGNEPSQVNGYEEYELYYLGI